MKNKMKNKTKFILLTVAMLISVTACNAAPPQEKATEIPSSVNNETVTETITEAVTKTNKADTEKQTEKLAEKLTEKLTEKPTKSEEQKLNFFTKTSDFTQELDNHLIEIAESKGITVDKSDESISFSADKSELKDIAQNYKDILTNKNDGLIKEIKISNDYKTFELFVKDGFEKSPETLITLLYAKPISDLQMLIGTKQEDVSYTQKIINADTKEIISEVVMPEALKNTNS